MRQYRKCVVYIPPDKAVYLQRAKQNGYSISALLSKLLEAYMEGLIDPDVLQKCGLKSKKNLVIK